MSGLAFLSFFLLQKYSIEASDETQGSSFTISSFQMEELKQLVNNKLHISEMPAMKTLSFLGQFSCPDSVWPLIHSE